MQLVGNLQEHSTIIIAGTPDEVLQQLVHNGELYAAQGRKNDSIMILSNGTLHQHFASRFVPFRFGKLDFCSDKHPAFIPLMLCRRGLHALYFLPYYQIIFAGELLIYLSICIRNVSD